LDKRAKARWEKPKGQLAIGQKNRLDFNPRKQTWKGGEKPNASMATWKGQLLCHQTYAAKDAGE